MQHKLLHSKYSNSVREMVVTCAEQCDGPQVSELCGCKVELGQGLNIVVDLADGGRDLLDVDGGVVPGEPGLLVTDDDAEESGDGHLTTDLRQAKHKQLRPTVPHQPHLCLVSEIMKIILMSAPQPLKSRFLMFFDQVVSLISILIPSWSFL